MKVLEIRDCQIASLEKHRDGFQGTDVRDVKILLHHIADFLHIDG